MMETAFSIRENIDVNVESFNFSYDRESDKLTSVTIEADSFITLEHAKQAIQVFDEYLSSDYKLSINVERGRIQARV